MISWFKQIDLPRTPRGHTVIVLSLIISQVLFKSIFAYDIDVGLSVTIADVIRQTLATNPGALLLPMEFEPTRIYWPTTTHLPLFALQKFLPPFLSFLAISSLLVSVVYFCALRVSGSIIFSISMGLMSGFGTQLLYAYSAHNIFGTYFYLCYLSLSLTVGYLLVTRRDKAPKRLGLFALALLFVALSWEQWVNYALWIFLAGSVATIWNQHHKGPLVSRNIHGAMAVTLAMLVLYLAIRIPAAQEYIQPGAEEELIFTYPTIVMMVDDFISSFFTYIYMSFSNFFPSFLVTSNTIQNYGYEAIIAEQNGYHEVYQHLVPMHHLFYWRYYAGAVTGLFLLMLWRSSFRAWKEPDIHHLILVVLALMIMSGFSTHMLVKYRPYLSVPALPYKATVSVFGVSVLISYLLMRARMWISSNNAYYGLVWGVWSLIIYEAFTRPKMLTTLLKHVGLTGKTDPAALLSGFFSIF